MGQNKLRVYVHFVWATWDRLPLITEEIERDLHRYISQVCLDNNCEVLACGGMPDHIHLLVSVSNGITFSELMKDVKGGSSRFVSEKLKAGEWFAWQHHYGAFSVSPSHKGKVIAYINNQKLHHTSNKLWPDAEQSLDSPMPIIR